MSNDDFPEPLGPTRATDWPSATERSTPRRILNRARAAVERERHILQIDGQIRPAGED